MKTLFISIVLMAIAYLAMPQVAIDKFKAYLPQQKVEQAAGNLLADVDTKLDSFKQTLSKRQESRISVLEEKIAIVERKLSQSSTFVNALAHSKNSSDQKIASVLDEQFAAVPKLASKQQLGKSYNYDELLSKANAKTALAANYDANYTLITQSGNKALESKKQRMDRQAFLQELAERMNKTSLLALTH
jgi:hypothetical protein